MGKGQGLALDGELEAAVGVLLDGAGEDASRDGLRDTPGRVARAWRASVAGAAKAAAEAAGAAVFEVGAAGEGAMVVVGNVELYSTSEADLRPLFGVAHLAYVPRDGRVLGLSKLARVAEVFAKRLQDPRRLAREIAQGIDGAVVSAGVAVRLELQHLRAGAAGVEAVVADAAIGCFVGNDGRLAEFEALLQLQVTAKAAAAVTCAPCVAAPAKGAMPAVATDPAFAARRVEKRPAMEDAVRALLQNAGEPMGRAGLERTPERVVDAFLAATEGYGWDIGRCLAAAACGAEPPQPQQQPPLPLELECALPVSTMCEHHLLPFFGTAHVAYAGGRQRLPRAAAELLVTMFSRRLQVQERLTRQVAEAIAEATGAPDVVVVVEAGHMCMLSRGVEKTSSRTSSIAAMGSYADDAARRAGVVRDLLRAVATRT